MKLVRLTTEELRALEVRNANAVQAFKLEVACGIKYGPESMDRFHKAEATLAAVRRDLAESSTQQRWLVG